MDLGLAESVCLVTGSTGGIGLETATLLRAEGATVVTTGRSGGARCGPTSRNRVSPSASCRETIERLPGVWTCSCTMSATARSGKPRARHGRGSGRRPSELNLISCRPRDARRTARDARAGSGTIVNVSSTAAKRPSPGMPDYSVMKAALLSFSRLVADLYAKDGIRCNAVTPGPTATEAWLGEGGLADQQGRARRGARQGRRRPTARPARPARGDRLRDRLPLLAARELRHRRRLERRRRHGADHSLNSTLMLSRSWMRRIASANSAATETTSTFASGCGWFSTVSVKKSRSIGLSSSFPRRRR